MQQITRKKMTKNNNNTCKRSFFVGWYDDNLWSYTFIPFYSKEFFLLKSLIFIRHAWFFIALYSHFSDCFSFQRKVCMTFNSVFVLAQDKRWMCFVCGFLTYLVLQIQCLYSSKDDCVLMASDLCALNL